MIKTHQIQPPKFWKKSDCPPLPLSATYAANRQAALGSAIAVVVAVVFQNIKLYNIRGISPYLRYIHKLQFAVQFTSIP